LIGGINSETVIKAGNHYWVQKFRAGH